MIGGGTWEGASMFDMRRRSFITLLGGTFSVFLCVSAAAQEGYYEADHDKWHEAPAVASWTVALLKAVWSATITKSK